MDLELIKDANNEVGEIIDPDRNYRQEMFDKYENFIHDDIIDDSWVEDEDKINLINHCKETVNIHYSMYPSPMNEILIKKIYYDTIKNMNQDDYFREKAEVNQKSILEIELSKIDKLSGM